MNLVWPTRQNESCRSWLFLNFCNWRFFIWIHLLFKNYVLFNLEFIFFWKKKIVIQPIAMQDNSPMSWSSQPITSARCIAAVGWTSDEPEPFDRKHYYILHKLGFPSYLVTSWSLPLPFALSPTLSALSLPCPSIIYNTTLLASKIAYTDPNPWHETVSKY